MRIANRLFRSLALFVAAFLASESLVGAETKTGTLSFFSMWEKFNQEVEGRLTLSSTLQQINWISAHANQSGINPFAAYEGKQFSTLEPVWTHSMTYEMKPSKRVTLTADLDVKLPSSGQTEYWPYYPGGSDIGIDGVNYRFGQTSFSFKIAVDGDLLKYTLGFSTSTENVDRIGAVNPFQSFTVNGVPYRQAGILLNPLLTRDWISMVSTQYEYRLQTLSFRVSPTDSKTSTAPLQPTLGATLSSLEVVYTNARSLNQDTGTKNLAQSPYKSVLSVDANLKIFPSNPLNFTVGGAWANTMVGNKNENPGIGVTALGNITLDPGPAQVLYAGGKWTTDGVALGVTVTMTNTPYRIKTGLSSTSWAPRDQFSAAVGALRAYEKDLYYRQVNMRLEIW